MSKQSNPVSDRQELLQSLASHVERIWRQSRPKLVKLYQQSGQLQDRLLGAAENWLATEEHLASQGLPQHQASKQAMLEWVYLPDQDEAEEAVAAPAAPTSG